MKPVTLAALCSKIVDPYIIGGDFNIVRFSSEKNRNFYPNRFSSIFNTFINVNELRDICRVQGVGTPGLTIRRYPPCRSWIEYL
jgi:hypothetical protein